MPHLTVVSPGSHPIRRLALSTALVLGALGMAGYPAPRVVSVRLQGNEFTPKDAHVRVGDSIRFVNGNGGPHNVKFADDSISAAARALLEKAMGGEKIGPLSSPLLLDPGETYAFVVPAVPAGRYPLFCLPHMANMRGALIVDP